jgi:phospholipid/cholesterol/gamma-HCH transport system substrate-binding protein
MNRPAGAQRTLAVIVLAVVTLVVAGVLLQERSAYEVQLRTGNASQLVKGNLVKVGGVQVGTVKDIDLTPDGGAVLRLKITDEELTPLPAGTTSVIRVSSLSSVANRFVALRLGPNAAGTVPDGGTLPEIASTPAVEIDEILNTLDADSRDALQRLVTGSAQVYAGRERQANHGLEALDPAVSELSGTLAELARDDAALNTFLVASAATVSAVASRDPDLANGLRDSATTAGALATERIALQSTLTRAPATLQQATSTLRSATRTGRALLPVARAGAAVAPRLTRLTAQLRPFFRESAPVLDQLRAVLPELQAVLSRARALERSALPAFTSLRRAATELQPIAAGVRPYAPDVLGGLINGFGNTAAGYYDANGDYARVAPIVSGFSATGLAGQVLPNSILGASSGNVKRCPGGAATAPDGSAPSKPDGVDCDPGTTPK